jgi:hypothetical protein
MVHHTLTHIRKSFTIKAQKLCNGDYQMPVKIELWDYDSSGTHTYLGETTVSVNELRTNKNITKTFHNKEKKAVGTLVFSQVIQS